MLMLMMTMMMLMGHDGGDSAAAGAVSALGGSGADEDDDIGEAQQLLLSSLTLLSPSCSSCPRSLLPDRNRYTESSGKPKRPRSTRRSWEYRGNGNL